MAPERLPLDGFGVVPKRFVFCEGRLKGLELFCPEELDPEEVGGLPKKLEVLDCGTAANVDVLEPSVVIAGVAL